MTQQLTRRSIIKGAAGTAAAGALAVGAGRGAFAAPAFLRQTGSDVTVNFWHGFTTNLGEQIQKLIDEFNGQNNGVQVKATAQASYEETAQNLTLALQDGSNPDIALLSDVWWFRFYLAQALLPLNDLISGSQYPINDLVESFKVEGIRKGVQYWVPFARSTPLMYYNTDMFQAAGASEFPKTWSEFADLAPKLTDSSQQVGGLALGNAASYIAWVFQGVVWAYGGAYSDPDFTIRIQEKGAVDAGNLFLDGIKNKWAYLADKVEDDFTNGYAATAFASTGSLAGITTTAQANGINFKTAFLPGQVPGIDLHCSTGGSGFGLMANVPTERQQAAWKFVEFMSSYDKTVQWSQNTGYMPILQSAISGPEMAQFFQANPNFKTAVDQLPHTKPQDAARAFIPGGDKTIGDGVSGVLVNQTDPQTAFNAVAQQLAEAAAPIKQQVIALEGSLTSGAATPAAGGATPVSTPIA